jgi:tetratricopeptide (TPR) repeat protein
MTSLYDVLGARPDDDAQALKNAFRAAVKACHPDVHPNDPDAAMRFGQIIAANAVLRDAKRRAAYDQLLALERHQIRLKLDHQQLEVHYGRRQTWSKRMGATAAVVVVCALAGAYGLFTPVPVPVILTGIKDRPAAATVATAISPTSLDPIKKERIATPTPAKRTDVGSTGAMPETTKGDTDGAQAQPSAHARPVKADAADEAPGPGVAPLAADDRGTVVFATREPDAAPANSSGFYREAGILAYRAGDFPRAIANLAQAIRLDPNDAQAHNVRGNAWDEIGNSDNALADYDEAIRIDAGNPAFFHDRAIMWHRKGDLDKALVDLERAIRFSSSDPNIYCDRGLIWYEKGSQARAIADFNQAIKLDPNFTAAYISRGLIRHRDSEFVAVADLGKAIRVSRTVFDASRHLK